ncbi:MAG: hypothetical protein GY713_19500 [Actinomycetia bacterium]|nr:hypothetical protein [Actinomycetes bacterium]
MSWRGLIAAGALLLVLGGVGGWLIGRGGGEGSDAGGFVAPGMDTPTERRAEMMSIVDQYLAAGRTPMVTVWLRS